MFIFPKRDAEDEEEDLEEEDGNEGAVQQKENKNSMSNRLLA